MLAPRTRSPTNSEDTMNSNPDKHKQSVIQADTPTSHNGFVAWIQEPMGQMIAASVATISTFGIVLSGMWAINLALN